MHHHDNHKNGKENNRKWYLRILSWIEWSEDSRYTQTYYVTHFAFFLSLSLRCSVHHTFYAVRSFVQRLSLMRFSFVLIFLSLSLSPSIVHIIRFAAAIPSHSTFHTFSFTRAHISHCTSCITAHIYSSCVMSGVLLDRMVVNFRSLHYIYIQMYVCRIRSTAVDRLTSRRANLITQVRSPCRRIERKKEIKRWNSKHTHAHVAHTYYD